MPLDGADIKPPLLFSLVGAIQVVLETIDKGGILPGKDSSADGSLPVLACVEISPA